MKNNQLFYVVVSSFVYLSNSKVIKVKVFNEIIFVCFIFSVQKNPETKELNILSHVFKITAKVNILNFRAIIIFHEQDAKKNIINIRTSFFFINPLLCKWYKFV